MKSLKEYNIEYFGDGTAICHDCCMGHFVPSLKVDIRIHEKYHIEQLKMCELLGLDIEYFNKNTYERKKSDLREIYCYYNKDSKPPLHIRVSASVEYMSLRTCHILYSLGGMFSSPKDVLTAESVLSHYGSFVEAMKVTYRAVKHEFDRDVQIAICNRYGIKLESEN